MTRFLSTWGLSSQDDLVIRSLLRLLEGRTIDRWLFAPWNHADVVIINVDAHSSHTLEVKDQVVIESSRDLDRNGALFRPIRAINFLQVLNTTSNKMRTLTGTPEAPQPNPLPVVQARDVSTRSIISRIRSKLNLPG